jgi:excisionase family DNA binding protein
MGASPTTDILSGVADVLDAASKPKPDVPPWMTVAGLAERLRVHPETVRTWVRRGTVHAVRFGRAVRIPRAEVLRVEAEGLVGY